MRSTLFIGFISLLNFASPAFSEVSIQSKEPKWAKVLPPVPVAGSVEDNEDYQMMLMIQNERTPEQCAAAAIEEKVSIKTFFGGDNGPLTDKEVKKLKSLFTKYFIKVGLPTSKLKKYYNRPRPFTAHADIIPCIKKSSGLSYPSGHTSIARAVALVLSEKFPERAEQFMDRADEVAFHRVLGGVHYPTDIIAGKILADEMAKEFLNNQEFINDLNLALKE